MKNYTNVIVLGILLAAASIYFIVTKVNFNDVLLSMGYYENKITILNTGDLHGHLNYNNLNGEYFSLDESHLEMGMALVKGTADEIKKKNKETLFLDSGDMFHGTNEANVNKAEGIVEAVNLMGYDAMVPGNHEFNWGFERAMEINSQLNFPMLSANIFKDGKPAFDQYKTFHVGGKKIGVFGLTTRQFLQNMQIYGTQGITYEDPVKSAKTVIQELKKQKVDAIILISHLGDDADKEEIIKNVDGIDLVLSGHGHHVYEKADKVNHTYVAEAGSYSAYLGVAQMYFKNNGVAKITWRVTQSKDRSKEDKAIAEVAGKYHAIAMENGKEIIGRSTVDLDGIRTHVRTRETNLANLITDAMREQGEADITLFNGGGIRESVPKGDISLYTIAKPLPFVNSL
ncbi:MAG TPA: bifunctional UDP-sugar hydrolase/5'-nucleotidase, partial [Bacilli bacterium]